VSEANFDFNSYQEYPEELDYNNLKPCPHCKKPIPANAISCLYCGNSVSFFRRPRWIFWVAIFVLIAFVLMFVF
jgi:predicted nucleic acid-binding Zn ribbon protein